MATVIKIRNGEAVSVYDDRWRVILEALAGHDLNPAMLQRASVVEMDEFGDWVATLSGTAHEIARGRNRVAVISAEVDYLEARF